MRRVLTCVLAGLVLTGAAGGEEPLDLKQIMRPVLEDTVCASEFEVVLNHLDPLINDGPIPDDAGDLEAAVYAILAQNMFECGSFVQMIAAAAIDDPEFNAELRGLGVVLPTNPERARAAFRRLALFGVRTGSMESLMDSAAFWGFVAPGALEDGRLWAESLDAMTAEALLAEARLHQAQDNDLAKYLERMAALKGSPEAATLVARRALADPRFSGESDSGVILGHYLARAILAGAEDLQDDFESLHPDWRTRETIMKSEQSGDYSHEDHLLWR